MLVEVFGFGSRFASEVASINESSELLLTNDSVIICDMEKMTVNTSDVSDDRSLNHILDMHLSDLVSSGPRKMTLCRSGLCLVAFSCTDSSLWTVGLNTLNPTVTRSALQIPTLQLISPSIQVSQISVGHTHVLAADSLGRLYSFGRGECGQLGIGMKCPWTDHPIHVPVVNNALEEFVVGVSAGSLHSAVVTATGRVFTFGCGANCRLGLSRAVGSAVYPVETAGEGTMGWGASTVSSDDYGNAGSSKYGESYVSSCGPRDDDNVFIPQLVQDLEGVGSLLPNGTSTGVLMVSCGVWHTVAVAKDTYDVYVWGWSKYGQCGRPQEEIVRCPRRVSELDSILQVPQQKIVDDPCNYNCSDDTYDNESIAGIYCGAQYTAIHTKSGRVIIMCVLFDFILIKYQLMTCVCNVGVY